MQYSLKLYIAGRTSSALQAISNINQICEGSLAGEYNLQIIDVLESPQLAENDKIIATPTLIKETPKPVRRILGDFSDRDKVLKALDLKKQ